MLYISFLKKEVNFQFDYLKEKEKNPQLIFTIWVFLILAIDQNIVFFIGIVQLRNTYNFAKAQGSIWLEFRTTCLVKKRRENAKSFCHNGLENQKIEFVLIVHWNNLVGLQWTRAFCCAFNVLEFIETWVSTYPS